MIIRTKQEFEGIKKASQAVALTLKEMCEYVKPGMSAQKLDQFGANLLKKFGANSAPKLVYNFPGYTCICKNEEIAHGIPSKNKIFKEGDLINIDVSAELNEFFSDNGASFVLGRDIHGHLDLVNKSKIILKEGLKRIKAGYRIADLGGFIEKEAKNSGYKVIKNLAGHGVGKSLHEDPDNILNYRSRLNFKRFKKDSTVAVETFITTHSTIAETMEDNWTLIGNKGGFCAQHEHTILITDDQPVILTEANGIFDELK